MVRVFQNVFGLLVKNEIANIASIVWSVRPLDNTTQDDCIYPNMKMVQKYALIVTSHTARRVGDVLLVTSRKNKSLGSILQVTL